jgi:hypothetical protein
MKRTPKEIYEYETSRITGYEDKFEAIITGLAIPDETRAELMKLFIWNGNARAIKSKAYQELKR